MTFWWPFVEVTDQSDVAVRYIKMANFYLLSKNQLQRSQSSSKSDNLSFYIFLHFRLQCAYALFGLFDWQPVSFPLIRCIIDGSFDFVVKFGFKDHEENFHPACERFLPTDCFSKMSDHCFSTRSFPQLQSHHLFFKIFPSDVLLEFIKKLLIIFLKETCRTTIPLGDLSNRKITGKTSGFRGTPGNHKLTADTYWLFSALVTACRCGFTLPTGAMPISSTQTFTSPTLPWSTNQQVDI